MTNNDQPIEQEALSFGEIIDMTAFDQILEMDEDDEDREFSRGIVYDFFEQAASTFEKMDAAMKDKDLENLSGLGHFLKGSSATIGLNKVKDSCEKIQHWGYKKDEHDADISKATALDLIAKMIPVVKKECKEAERKLKAFYGEDLDDD